MVPHVRRVVHLAGGHFTVRGAQGQESRAHFAQPVTVHEMAASIHMSASAFHQRFKAVTSMSPLQYQKVLRLHEARRLMLFQNADASDACRRVGYLSSSQFSREYGRFFGNAPTKDIARLRETGFGPIK